ncbi:hypothetical protein BCJMU02_4971 [Bacillus cereus]|uniref:hypothetical protein n=1 Tax=Bacillus cereus group TaxID=86661 RepID=UPI001F446E2C|nr:hypothetical protein [Bacillus cereus]BCC49662.1 hypothetical protein BCJMU02_4971 [Bacillus cereus]HDX9665318.1 hypothetical protein [Bacillus cereus]
MSFSNKTDKKGFGFEYDVSDMFQMQGYLTRRGVPLQYGTTNQDATDVDVFGVKFIGLFEKHIIVCDCKNKARAKPYERIFWAKGLGEFVKASNVYVALTKTQPEIIEFASMGGVKVLTSDIISQYSNLDNPYGLADASYFGEFEKKVEKILKRNKIISSIFPNYKKLFLHNNPYLALNIAIADIEEITRELKFFPDSKDEVNLVLRYLVCELTSIVGFHLLSISSDVLGLPESRRREHIRNKLTFGEMEPRVVLNLMENASDLANEIIKSSVPKSVAPKLVDFGPIEAPSYADSIVGLVERALARPQMYLNMPQLLDFMLFEQGFKGKEYSEEEFIKIFGHGMSDERIKAPRNILAFIRGICGIDWQVIWGKNKSDSTEQSEGAVSKSNTELKKEKTVSKDIKKEVELKPITNQDEKEIDSKNK